jgi:hypothetical protein
MFTMGNNFDTNYENGCAVEDFLKEVLYNLYGWTFIAGAKAGVMVNVEYIESEFNCKYIPPVKKKHGPQLQFGNDKPLVMPDMLLKSKNEILFWIESKASYDCDYFSIDIEEDKLLDYIQIHNKTKTTWLVVSVIDKEENFCEIYSARIKTIETAMNDRNKSEKIVNHIWGKVVYRFPLTNRIFSKIYSGTFS